jgi:hypothetical protein
MRASQILIMEKKTGSEKKWQIITWMTKNGQRMKARFLLI